MTYRTIVIDPPWAYDTKSPMAGSVDAAAERQYDVMSLDAIAALPIRSMADKSAHLYLWTTNPFLFESRWLAECWGFRYVTMLTWHKLGAPGMGYYFRGDTEHALFAVRGDAPIAPDIRVSNHFAAAKGRHSEKPDRFYEIVERVSPGPWLEVFARRRRVGWGAWGNEAPGEEEARTQQHMNLVP